MATRPEVTELTMVRRDNILRIMKDADWDRKQMAKKAGVKYATLSASLGENPKSNIGDKIAGLIETALNKPPGFLDKDRRNASASNGSQVPGTVSMKANGFVVEDKAVNKYQANEIMRILLEE